MRILLLGSGGREHALAWKIQQSEKVDKLFVAPGNAGTAILCENVNIGVNDFDAQKEFCLKEHIDMVVVGPEDPLVKGVYDNFAADSRTSHIPVIGPSARNSIAGADMALAKPVIGTSVPAPPCFASFS